MHSPGRHLAHNGLWITFVSILSTFNIEKALDENGLEIDPPSTYEGELMRY